MSLSKSKYTKGIQCKKILWLEKNKPEEKEEENNEAQLNTGNVIHEIAKYLFGSHVNINFNQDLNEMLKDTMSTIESYKDVVITEASFNYNNNFCSVDILVKKGNKYEMYEVKSSTKLKDVYISDASYQYYVLKSLGLNVTKCFLVHLNSDYVRHGMLDLDKLFIKEDILNDVISNQEEVKRNIEDINLYLKNEKEPSKDIDINCFKPYDCPFFNYCTRNITKPNVFDISGMTTKEKIDLYNKGIISFEDLLKSNIKEKYKKQVEYEVLDKEPYIEEKKIKDFLSTLTYPLYFLDFETYQQPIPLYDNVSPYMQIPFQYSLHYIEKEDGPLMHTEYLGDGVTDPRRALAEKLVKDIPKDVCTVAYNMSFEKSVIKSLARIYPDLSEHLMNIYNNMKDLMIPFKNKDYYMKEFKGSYSIKYVLPALYPEDESLNYHNLDMVHNGSEAMNSYANLSKLDNEKQKVLRYNMLKYCELDTYAMVKIYNKLKEEVD